MFEHFKHTDQTQHEETITLSKDKSSITLTCEPCISQYTALRMFQPRFTFSFFLFFFWLAFDFEDKEEHNKLTRELVKYNETLTKLEIKCTSKQTKANNTRLFVFFFRPPFLVFLVGVLNVSDLFRVVDKITKIKELTFNGKKK